MISPRSLSSARTVATSLALGLATLAARGAASLPPQKTLADEPPQVLETPAGTTEVGVLDGTEYRIDIPSQWNGSLVIWYHGYAEHGTSFHIAERLGPDLENFLARHFAVAQSAYSEPGWALPQAYPETEALRRYFVRKYGQPRDWPYLRTK